MRWRLYSPGDVIHMRDVSNVCTTRVDHGHMVNSSTNVRTWSDMLEEAWYDVVVSDDGGGYLVRWALSAHEVAQRRLSTVPWGSIRLGGNRGAS